VQVIYNIFEQEPADELLPAALEHNVGILVRVVFDGVSSRANTVSTANSQKEISVKMTLPVTA
jgi:aryl-alcohol dehydrogenase-like predicted oxidoreductase